MTADALPKLAPWGWTRNGYARWDAPDKPQLYDPFYSEEQMLAYGRQCYEQGRKDERERFEGVGTFFESIEHAGVDLNDGSEPKDGTKLYARKDGS